MYADSVHTAGFDPRIGLLAPESPIFIACAIDLKTTLVQRLKISARGIHFVGDTVNYDRYFLTALVGGADIWVAADMTEASRRM